MTILVQRSFIIERGTQPEFERLSREHIWPYMEARGCRIVGLFRNLHGGPSNEILLLTAYDSMGHWESTRDDAPLPPGASDDARALHPAYVDALRERRKFVQVTSTRVLQPCTTWVDYGVRSE